MRTLNLLITLLILLALSAPQVLATADPDPDGIGVYFDLQADIWQNWIGANIPFNAYVILTNPSGEEILGYEFAYQLLVTPGMENLIFGLGIVFPDFVPIVPPWPIYDIFAGEVVKGPFAPAPMPGNPAVVLATWQFMLLTPNIWAEFYLAPTSGEGMTNGRLAYDSEAGPVTMYTSTGHPEIPVATINREGVVPITETTYGSLKALYR